MTVRDDLVLLKDCAKVVSREAQPCFANALVDMVGELATIFASHYLHQGRVPVVVLQRILLDVLEDPYHAKVLFDSFIDLGPKVSQLVDIFE